MLEFLRAFHFLYFSCAQQDPWLPQTKTLETCCHPTLLIEAFSKKVNPVLFNPEQSQCTVGKYINSVLGGG